MKLNQMKIKQMSILIALVGTGLLAFQPIAKAAYKSGCNPSENMSSSVSSFASECLTDRAKQQLSKFGSDIWNLSLAEAKGKYQGLFWGVLNNPNNHKK